MNENFGRKIAITVALIAAAVVSLLLPLVRNERPLRLGLDLQGGTRLVFAFDFEQAAAEGKISQAELADKPALLNSIREIIHNRLDPKGVKEISIRTQGQNRLVIELPGAADFGGSRVLWKIAADLPVGAREITLDPGPPAGTDVPKIERTTAIETIKQFPPDGGVVLVDDEQIEYSGREGNILKVKSRGTTKTKEAAHSKDAQIELLTNNELVRTITSVGDMQFMIEAQANDPELARLGTDLTKERQKLDTWMQANPGVELDRFNRLPTAQGGPVENLRWFLLRTKRGEVERPIQDRIHGLLIASNEAWRFNGADLDHVQPSSDSFGLPAVGLEMSDSKKGAFADYSEANVKRNLGIVLSGEIVTLAEIKSPLTGNFVIEGGGAGFTRKEVNDLVSVLKSGSLQVKPELRDQARVGASLGQDYIETGMVSMIVALGVIMLFMLVIYRKLGVISIIGLVLNVFLLAGAMAFMRATLTLPGVAGMILTLGMAVDGNILIYERLREELARGLKPIQACKAAFERAAVTIIDSNLTSLIAGVILYYMGTGPIRGFAVTLNLGILSTLFTVIVVTEILVFFDLKRGSANLSMAKIFTTPKYAFMKIYKAFLFGSWTVIAVGIVCFLMLPDAEKYGIDFLGGITMKVRTAEPVQVDAIRARIGTIQGALGQAEVKQIADSSVSGRGYTLFTVTYKSPAAQDAESQTELDVGERQIKSALAGLLAPDPVQVTLTSAETADSLAGGLAFERNHSAADVAKELTGKGLASVNVEAVPGDDTSFKFTAGIEKGHSAEQVSELVRSSFVGKKDSSGTVYSLRSPIPESSVVGPQVGTELRNKAFIAVVLSLLGSLLYLRIRFAEISYGLGVVVALIHDVFMTLTGIAIANWTGLVQAEIDLATVAAFLTIIGYSQNDTIVIFDRVRENRPKSNAPLEQVLNDSINQTLARTIMTSGTVLLTLLVLFAFNYGTRNVLESFSFAMIVGVISGCYSTVYIASPVLLWFERRQARKGGPTPGGLAAAAPLTATEA